MKRKDLAGSRFGTLVVISMANPKRYPSGQIKLRWNCACDCGTEIVVDGGHLTSGHTSNCGSCRKITHGESDSKLYGVWEAIKQRCQNPKSSHFHHYGGRGIKLCESWQQFENFAADMGPTYRDGLTIDRRDNNGNYEASNCRWAVHRRSWA